MTNAHGTTSTHAQQIAQNMAHTLDFPLGRPLIPTATIRRQRMLPEGASTQVTIGDQVQAQQPIATINSNGQQRTIQAGFSGRVVDVALNQRVSIEGTASIIQGIVGMGSPATGQLCVLPQGESLAMVPILPGGVILFPQKLPLMLVQRAVAGGAAGIIAGSMSAHEFEAFARLDLSALLDGFPIGVPPAPLTIVITEGLGSAPMNSLLYQVLSQRLNATIYLSGEISMQQALRPEVILSPPVSSSTPQPLPLDNTLETGARVIVWNGVHRGANAQVLQVLARRQYNAAGLLAPAAVLRFEDGSTDIVPLHTLDRIG